MRWIRTLHQPWLVACAVAVIAAGCDSFTPLTFRPQSSLDDAELTMAVEPQGQPGTFTVSGTADLPSGTELNVMAVRRLRLKKVPLVTTRPPLTYAILNYERATVEGDRWQATLALWQVDSEGRYQEAWQLQSPDLRLEVTPEDEVFFLVTLTPLDNLAAIEQELAAQNQRFDRQYIQTTSEGDRYFQTGKVLEVALPTGKTDPVEMREEDINGGWGNRFLELPDLPNEQQLEFPEQRQTNAPVMPEEFLY